MKRKLAIGSKGSYNTNLFTGEGVPWFQPCKLFVQGDYGEYTVKGATVWPQKQRVWVSDLDVTLTWFANKSDISNFTINTVSSGYKATESPKILTETGFARPPDMSSGRGAIRGIRLSDGTHSQVSHHVKGVWFTEASSSQVGVQYTAQLKGPGKGRSPNATSEVEVDLKFE